MLGIGLGIVGAIRRAWQLKPFDRIFGAYVEVIRNTPFLVQLFFIFFGLPSLGVKMGEWETAVLAMVINLGAYSTEIIRAGIIATPRGQLEAAGQPGNESRRDLPPRGAAPGPAKWPALTSQVIIVMLGPAVCSQIATEELTFAANFIQSRSFRAFETYFVTTGIYFLLAVLLRQVLMALGRRFVTGGRPDVTQFSTWDIVRNLLEGAVDAGADSHRFRAGWHPPACWCCLPASPGAACCRLLQKPTSRSSRARRC